MASKKTWHGFTIIELLIGGVLMAIVIFALGNIMITNFKLFLNESSVINITEANKIALDEITNQIRESQSIAATCTPCSPDTTSANILILQLWPLNANGEPFDGGINYDYIVYKKDSTDSTKLRKIIYPYATSSRPNSNKVLSTNISALTFIYNNATPSQASEVTVKIKNTTNNSGKVQEIERESKAVLRNK